LSLVLDRPRRRLLKGSTSFAIPQSILPDGCTATSPKQADRARRHHRPFGSTPSTLIGRTTRSSQIAIERAATPQYPSRDFLLWRFSNAGHKPPRSPRRSSPAGIRKPSHERKFVSLFDPIKNRRGLQFRA
jgi:hypothetical protein